MHKSNNLIVSADDFGISPKANKNILQLLESQKIERVSLMTDGIFTEEELRKLKESEVKIDIHLSVHNSKKHRPEIKESAFLRGIAFSLGLARKNMRPTYVALHWQDQIDKFKELIGRSPDGINSHQHVHFFPSYFRTAIGLAQSNGIPYIRFGQSLIRESGAPVYRILNWLHKKNLSQLESSGLNSSHQLVSLDWISDISLFLDNEFALPVEIVCHPEREKEFKIMEQYL